MAGSGDGREPNVSGVEVVGNPKDDDKIVYCAKREWRGWVDALNGAHTELDAKDAELARLREEKDTARKEWHRSGRLYHEADQENRRLREDRGAVEEAGLTLLFALDVNASGPVLLEARKKLAGALARPTDPGGATGKEQ